jgi:hypothetical protein
MVAASAASGIMLVEAGQQQQPPRLLGWRPVCRTVVMVVVRMICAGITGSTLTEDTSRPDHGRNQFSLWQPY